MHNLTEEEKLVREEAKMSFAHQICNDQRFINLIQDMKWELFGQWLTSESTEKREEIHKKLLGVVSVQGKVDSLNVRFKQNQETDNGA